MNARMRALHRQLPARIVFEARAEARALLWAAGKLDLQRAVDRLQAAAEETGLVIALGQDTVQQIMANAFGKVRP